MSDGISRIEVKNAAAYNARYGDEHEERGLLRTAPDIGGGDGGDERGQPSPARQAYDDSGLLPAMIENGLDKIGVL
jgi:hypothetical protein